MNMEICSGVFRTQSNNYDRNFLRKSLTNFRKNLHHRCLMVLNSFDGSEYISGLMGTWNTEAKE